MPLESEMASYPGLNAVASDLWRKWLKIYQRAFRGFSYNVRIGQGIRPPSGATPEEAALWKQLTQKRIDVVGERDGQTWIIEIDERPIARTLGQLHLYKRMYPKYYTPQPFLQGALICTYLGFDMFGAFAADDDLIFKFPVGKPPSLPPQFLPPEAGTAFTVLAQSNA